MADDILHDFLSRLAQWAPPAEVTRVELELRERWAGSSHYIKGAQAGKVRSLAGSLAAGVSLKEAFDRAGVSRATGYRLLARRWSCR